MTRFVGEIERSNAPGRARGIHKNVDATQLGAHSIDDAPDVITLGDIGGQLKGPAAEGSNLRRGLPYFLGAPADRDDVGSRLGQPEGNRLAKPTRPAENQRSLPFQAQSLIGHVRNLRTVIQEAG